MADAVGIYKIKPCCPFGFRGHFVAVGNVIFWFERVYAVLTETVTGNGWGMARVGGGGFRPGVGAVEDLSPGRYNSLVLAADVRTELRVCWGGQGVWGRETDFVYLKV